MRDLQFAVGWGLLVGALSLAVDWPLWKVIVVGVQTGVAFAVLVSWLRATR